MPEEQHQAREGVPAEELEEQDGELLPRREVMSVVELGDGFSTNPIYTLPVQPPDEV